MAQSELPLGEISPEELAEHLDHIDAPPEKWAGVLARMVDLLASHFRRHGREDAAAVAEAQQIVALIAQDQGGRPIYLPRGDRLKQALVARQIYLLHNGRNVQELAERFGYTTRHVQRVYAEQRAIDVRRRQPDLFPP